MMELGFQHSLTYLKASYSPLGLRCSSDGKESACNAEDTGLIPGEENGNPLQHSCLENSIDRGAWWTTVHGVAKSQTRLTLLLP